MQIWGYHENPPFLLLEFLKPFTVFPLCFSPRLYTTGSLCTFPNAVILTEFAKRHINPWIEVVVPGSVFWLKCQVLSFGFSDLANISGGRFDALVVDCLGGWQECLWSNTQVVPRILANLPGMLHPPHFLPRINVILSPKMSVPWYYVFSNRFCCLLAKSVIASVITWSQKIIGP